MGLGSAAELPPSAEQVYSPYDPEARYSKKRDVTWIGYKAQVTETRDPACKGPHVITNVETSLATAPDDNTVAIVHQSLETRGLLPGEYLVDSKRRYGVTIVGPVADDSSWQARLDEGLTKAAFQADWARRVATCPAGREKHLLAAECPHGERHGLRGALRDLRLHSMPTAPALHPGQARAAHHWACRRASTSRHCRARASSRKRRHSG